MPEQTFNVSPVIIPDNYQGAARILAQLSKPNHVEADMKKLRDLLCLMAGETPFNNRSRSQVVESASIVWARLSHAVKVGEWFERMCVAHIGKDERINEKGLEYGRALARSLSGKAPEQAWEPWKPVAHMAAAFRLTLFSSNRGLFFCNSSVPATVRIDQLSELLRDHTWVAPAVQAAGVRMAWARQIGLQAPKLTRFFILVEPDS